MRGWWGAADADPQRSLYTLVYERPPSLESALSELADRVDRSLGELNLEYAQKRSSDRLGPLELLPVEAGTADAYKKHCIERG